MQDLEDTEALTCPVCGGRLEKGVNEDRDEIWSCEDCPVVMFTYSGPANLQRLVAHLHPAVNEVRAHVLRAATVAEELLRVMDGLEADEAAWHAAHQTWREYLRWEPTSKLAVVNLELAAMQLTRLGVPPWYVPIMRPLTWITDHLRAAHQALDATRGDWPFLAAYIEGCFPADWQPWGLREFAAGLRAWADRLGQMGIPSPAGAPPGASGGADA